MKIYLITNIRRKFDMLIDIEETSKGVLQQRDILKSLIAIKCSMP